MNIMTASVAAVLVLAAEVAHAAIEEHYEEKPITIRKASGFDRDKRVKIRVGEKVTFVISVYQDEFFDQPVIIANAVIDNSTAQNVKAVYSISFHDKDGKLVGCHQGEWDLEPEEDINYGSGIIHADPKLIGSVTSYKLRTQVFESKKE